MKNVNQEYDDKLFAICVAVLPSVVSRLPDDASESEAVDYAVVLARSLLSELGYVYRTGGKRA